MAKKDGYQEYLDARAREANAAGAAHHDPAVRWRQGMQTGGMVPEAGSGDGGLGVIVLLVATPIVLPGIAFYRTLVEWWARGNFDRARGGIFLDNAVVDGILVIALVLAVTILAARFVGYFMALGALSVFCLASQSPIAILGNIFVLYLYLWLSWAGFRKYVLRRWTNWAATVVAMLVIMQAFGVNYWLWTILGGYFPFVAVEAIITYFAVTAVLALLYRAWKALFG